MELLKSIYTIRSSLHSLTVLGIQTVCGIRPMASPFLKHLTLFLYLDFTT